MGTILTSTDYPNGSELSVQDHNTNIHSTGPSHGIMSVANGRLDNNNLADDFEVEAVHVMYEQAALARTESMRESNTIYADAAPSPDNESFDFSDLNKWFVVPGCSLRWYQPYAASAALIHWTFFASANRWFGWAVDRDDNFWQINPETAVICALDGTMMPSTRRYLPPNLHVPISPGGKYPGIDLAIEGGVDSSSMSLEGDGNPRYVDSEAHTGLHWDLCFLQENLSAGFHEISVHCRIESVRNQEIEMQTTPKQAADPFVMRGFFIPTNHVSFGIRNARVLTLL